MNSNEANVTLFGTIGNLMKLSDQQNRYLKILGSGVVDFRHVFAVVSGTSILFVAGCAPRVQTDSLHKAAEADVKSDYVTASKYSGMNAAAHPKDAAAIFNFGLELEKAGKKMEAIHELETVVQMKSDPWSHASKTEIDKINRELKRSK